MKHKIMIFSLLMLVILPQVLISQSNIDFNLIGAGARARGMGGAFIGVADDATAASWNPAGLARLEKAEASVVGIFQSYSIDTDIESFDADPYKSSHFSLNFVSGAFPLTVGERNLVAAVAYQQMIDLYYKYDSDNYLMERTGGVNAISPSVGVQLTPNLSLGAAINIFTGSSKYVEEDKSGYYDDIENTFNWSGTNFNFGALFDFDRFRIGAVFKTPFGLTEENDNGGYKSTLYMPQMLGIGMALSVTENFLVAADVDMRKYSNAKIEENESGEKEKLEWEDINQLRFGMEYLFISGTSILPLRLGFASTPTLYKDDEDNQIKGANLTAGIGLIMGNVNLDLGMEFNVYAWEIDDGYGTAYDYSENYFRFIVSGVFHFGN